MSSKPLLLQDRDGLDEFPISQRLRNILLGFQERQSKPLTAGQMRKADDATLRACYGMGPIMLAELREVLSALDYERIVHERRQGQ